MSTTPAPQSTGRGALLLLVLRVLAIILACTSPWVMAEERTFKTKLAPVLAGQQLEFFKLLNAQAPDQALLPFKANHVWTDLRNLQRPMIGPKAAGAEIRTFTAAFPDLRITPKRIITGRRLSIVQGVLSGTQTGTFEGLSVTHKPVRVETLMISWFDDTSVRQTLFHWNRDQIRRQLAAPVGTKGLLAPSAPWRVEKVSGKGVPVTTALIAQAYGVTANAAVVHFSDRSGDATLGKLVRQELAFSELAGMRRQVRTYAERVPKIRVDLVETFTVDKYLIARFDITSENTLRHAVVIGRTDGKGLETAQVYFSDPS